MKKPTKKQISLWCVCFLFIILGSGETPETWSFAAFFAYHIGCIAIAGACAGFALPLKK